MRVIKLNVGYDRGTGMGRGRAGQSGGDARTRARISGKSWSVYSRGYNSPESTLIRKKNRDADGKQARE
jgi:hypothetical protein